MKKTTMLLTALLCSFMLKAQNFEWAVHHGGMDYDETADVELLNDKSVIVAGIFGETIDIEPGSGETLLSTNGDSDIFIQKLDKDGNLIWAKQIGGSGRESAVSISQDNEGNIFVSGSFKNTVDFDPGEGLHQLTSEDESDAFVLKLSPNGEFIWVKQFGGTLNQVASSNITDDDGNIIIGGYFNGTVDFDPNGPVYNLTSQGGLDNFIVKLDYNGNFLWAGSYGAGSTELTGEITVDTNNDIIITGFFNGTVDFDIGEGTHELTASAGTDAYVLKLNESGSFVWVSQLENPQTEAYFGVTTDQNDDVYVAGSFYGTITYGSDELTSNGAADIIVLKMSSDGDYIWATSAGGNDYDIGASIAVDTSDNVFVTGYYAGVVDMDPGEDTYNLSSIDGSYDVFVQKLTYEGQFEWAQSIGNDGFEWGVGISANDAGDILVYGGFNSSSVDFDFTDNTQIFEYVGGDMDSFVLKLIDPKYQTIEFPTLEAAYNQTETVVLQAVATSELLVSYQIEGPANLSGNELTFTGVGNVTVTATQDGNKYFLPAEPVEQSFEVIKHDQTITFEADLSSVRVGDQLTLEASASSGLPVSFTSSNTQVAVIDGTSLSVVGAGTSIITASQPGDDTYNAAEEVSNTLEASEVLGLMPDEIRRNIKLFPVPVSNQLTIQSGEEMNVTRAVLYGVDGQVVHDWHVASGNRTFSLPIDTQPGVYLLRLHDHQDRVVTYRFVKK